MLQINFYPESDKQKYIQATNEYQLIWKKDKIKILELIKKYSGIDFKTKVINAIIFDYISSSMPMNLEEKLTYNQKEAVIVHELLHRLLVDNNFQIPYKENSAKTIHQIIDLILFDIWTDLFGEIKAKENIKHEISYGDLNYKNAWKWALSFSKDERKNKFEKIKLKYQTR
jgi:hypothetical protein